MKLFIRIAQYSFTELIYRLIIKLKLFQKLKYSLYLIPYAPYFYGLKTAVSIAKETGEKKLIVIEFGVAGGNGLLALQKYADLFEVKEKVTITVLGLDTGKGLPKSSDYRDLPYLWQEGDYPMDESKLRAKLLPKTRLIIGDVKHKIKDILKISAELDSKIAFISFDLDLYSSTKNALKILHGSEKVLLPRIPLYFDDVIGTIHQIGQLASIDEFNSSSKKRSIGSYFNIQSTIPFKPNWANKFFEFHFFNHKDYSKRRSLKNIKDLPLSV